MFKITDGKGFHITFANGWTASVQWGVNNNCENNLVFSHPTGLCIHRWAKENPDAGAKGSKTAEIMAWDKDGNWYNFGADQFKGYVTPNEVLMFLNMVAGF